MDEDDVNETARLARTSERGEEADRGGSRAKAESDRTSEGPATRDREREGRGKGGL